MSEIQQPPIDKTVPDRLRTPFRGRGKFRFSAEIRLIPRWLVMAVVAAYLINLAIAVAVSWNGAGNHSPLVIAMAVSGLSIPVAAYTFLVAYVNRDAKRRGMSPTLWTLLVVFLPGTPISGCIIYLLVREPLPYNCPQCGSTVRADFNFCPQCKRDLRLACPRCGHGIGESDRYCPNCGSDLADPGPVDAVPPVAS